MAGLMRVLSICGAILRSFLSRAIEHRGGKVAPSSNQEHRGPSHNKTGHAAPPAGGLAAGTRTRVFCLSSSGGGNRAFGGFVSRGNVRRHAPKLRTVRLF